MTKVTQQLHEAAMQILYGPNCPFTPTDRLPCTGVELANAMAEQDLYDREAVEELRRNNQAWQTDLTVVQREVLALQKKQNILIQALQKIAQYDMGQHDFKTAYKLRRDLANKTLAELGLPSALQEEQVGK